MQALLRLKPDFEVGEEVSEEIKMVDFGRRNILALRQNLVARIMEMEKDNVYKIYKDRIGDIITWRGLSNMEKRNSVWMMMVTN